MKLIYIFVYLLISFYCKVIFAQNIVVINIQSLIDRNDSYINTLKEIENSQENYLKNFKIKEEELMQMQNQIEDQLILNDNEINTRIDNYNKELSDFTIKVEEF